MPDSTISNLSSLTGAGLAPNDIFALVDVSDTSMGAGGTNKKITRTELCTFDMGSITTSTPILNLAQTWNAGGVTFTGLKLNVTDTASAAGSLLFDLQVGGASKFSIDKTGLVQSGAVFSSGAVRSVSNSGLFSLGSASDVILARDAANTLALRNGTSAQAFNVYNTYTDASNYERGVFGWGSNLFVLGTEKAGTGIPRALQIRIDGNNVWQFNPAGHLVANSDNTFDIGANGANRPRNIFVAGTVTTGGLLGGTAGYVGWSGRVMMRSPSDGVLAMYNNAETDFGRLQFGGTTSTFPALKRSGQFIQARLADDSAFTSMQMVSLIFQSGSYIVEQGNGVVAMYNASGNNFDRLQFGGTTSSFPALKRATTSLLVRLADDSGFGFFNAYVDSTNTTAVNSVGYRGVPQNTQNADYTFALTDSGLHVFHDEVSARTYTIPTNASVAFNIGSTITIVNNTGAGNITLTSADTIRRGDGVAGTGSRTIGPDSIVTLLKTKATEWMISGAFF